MELTSTPRLGPGCRLHPTGQVLLIPEGTLELTGPTGEILARLDGRRSIAELIDLLLAEYPGAGREVIQQDVLDLLERMQQRGVVRI